MGFVVENDTANVLAPYSKEVSEAGVSNREWAEALKEVQPELGRLSVATIKQAREAVLQAQLPELVCGKRVIVDYLYAARSEKCSNLSSLKRTLVEGRE